MNERAAGHVSLARNIMELASLADEKVRGSLKSLWFILWAPWISIPKFQDNIFNRYWDIWHKQQEQKSPSYSCVKGESQGLTKVIRILPLGTTNACRYFHCNPSVPMPYCPAINIARNSKSKHAQHYAWMMKIMTEKMMLRDSERSSDQWNKRTFQ